MTNKTIEKSEAVVLQRTMRIEHTHIITQTQRNTTISNISPKDCVHCIKMCCRRWGTEKRSRTKIYENKKTSLNVIMRNDLNFHFTLRSYTKHSFWLWHRHRLTARKKERDAFKSTAFSLILCHCLCWLSSPYSPSSFESFVKCLSFDAFHFCYIVFFLLENAEPRLR